MSNLSGTQIDKLGERLRAGEPSQNDLRLLDQYRQSFAEAYEHVVGIIRDRLALQPTGRAAKSSMSIAEKLKRESIRLSQIQDIAGCRIVVAEIAAQNRAVEQLTRALNDVVVVDRRERPSHGYRAVHVIAKHGRKLIEIQVRSLLQHMWAEFSEKLADVVDPALKYGGGPDRIREMLSEHSSAIVAQEALEAELASVTEESRSIKILPKNLGLRINKLHLRIEAGNLKIRKAMELAIKGIPDARGGQHVISD